MSQNAYMHVKDLNDNWVPARGDTAGSLGGGGGGIRLLPWTYAAAAGGITNTSDVTLIAAAGVVGALWQSAALGLAGLASLALLLRIDAKAGGLLLPLSAGDLTRAAGAGYLMIFALEVATIAFTVYGPAFVQVLHGASPLVAGYVITAIRPELRLYPGDKLLLMSEGLLESVQIAILATAVGILLAIPIGLMAARNLSPFWLSGPTRGFIAICRSLHYVIVAILFVKALGFGALAGVDVAGKHVNTGDGAVRIARRRQRHVGPHRALGLGLEAPLPVAVVGVANLSRVVAGGSQTCGFATAGKPGAYCWGGVAEKDARNGGQVPLHHAIQLRDGQAAAARNARGAHGGVPLLHRAGDAHLVGALGHHDRELLAGDHFGTDIATNAPCRARASAMDRPMPRLPPVTKATLDMRGGVIGYRLWVIGDG